MVIFFATDNNPIFPEKSLVDNKFQKYLTHERYHREMDLLPDQELLILKEAHRTLFEEILDEEHLKLFRDYFTEDEPDTDSFEFLQKILPLKIPKIHSRGNVLNAYELLKWYEFYPYLNMGSVTPDIKLKLQKEHPEAYAIFERIRAKVEAIK